MANKWQLDDLPHIINVRADRIAGAQLRLVVGHSDVVDTNLRTLHHEISSADLSVSSLIASPSQVKISSTSASDDVGSTGATAVRVDGVTDQGVAVQEIVALDGQTAVTTTNTFKVVEKLVVVAAGSGGANAGILYAGSGVVTAGVPATTYMTMESGTNVSTGAVLAIPSGKRFVMTQLISAFGDTSKSLNFQCMHYVAELNLWFEAIDIHIDAGETVVPVEAFQTLNAGDVFLIKTKVDANSTAVTVFLAGYMLDA